MADTSPQVTRATQLKKSFNNPAAQPVQRKIHFSGGTFSSDGSRPGWRKFLKDFVVAEYNKANGTTYTSANLDLNKLNLDRCHRVSFSDIQTWLVNYLNGSMSKTRFTELTNTLYTASSADKASMVAERDRLFKAKTKKDKLPKARNLLSLLNSATGNVSLGDASINRGIQEQLDPNFSISGGKASATPRTRRILSALDDDEASGIPFTPTKKHVRSSHVGSDVATSTFTPKTKKLVNKHDVS